VGWLKWYNTCLASTGPELKTQYYQKKKHEARNFINTFELYPLLTDNTTCILGTVILLDPKKISLIRNIMTFS
jgi:hypothetical protein